MQKKEGKGKKKFKVRGSWGVYHALKHIQRNKWYDIGRPVTPYEFYAIVRGVNKLLAEELAKGETIIFPMNMGKIELREKKKGAWMIDGKVVVNYPINWNKTLKLWYEDSEAQKEKVLVRDESGSIYRAKYNKYKAKYENKSFYEFTLTRAIKQALKKNINNRQINTLW